MAIFCWKLDLKKLIFIWFLHIVINFTYWISRSQQRRKCPHHYKFHQPLHKPFFYGNYRSLQKVQLKQRPSTAQTEPNLATAQLLYAVETTNGGRKKDVLIRNFRHINGRKRSRFIQIQFKQLRMRESE